MAINITALNSSAVKYREEILHHIFYSLMETVSKKMTLLPGIVDSISLSEMTGRAELRPYTGGKNTQAPLALSSRLLQTYVGDVILEEEPEQLRQTVWGKRLSNTQPAKHPIEKDIILEVMNSVSEKMVEALFPAVRNAVGTTTLDLFDGFDTIVAADVVSGLLSAGKENYQVLGAITSANACDQLHAFFRACSQLLQNRKTIMYTSYDVFNAYNDCWKDENGALPYNQKFQQTDLQIAVGRCQLMPMVGMNNYIYLSRKENLFLGTDILSDAATVKVREIDNPWLAQFVLKTNFGVQFDSVDKRTFCAGNIAAGSGS